MYESRRLTHLCTPKTLSTRKWRLGMRNWISRQKSGNRKNGSRQNIHVYFEFHLWSENLIEICRKIKIPSCKSHDKIWQIQAVLAMQKTFRVGASCCHGGSSNRFFLPMDKYRFSNSIACANPEAEHTMYTHDHEKKDNHDNSLVFLTTKAREFVGARLCQNTWTCWSPASVTIMPWTGDTQWQCTCMQSITKGTGHKILLLK